MKPSKIMLPLVAALALAACGNLSKVTWVLMTLWYRLPMKPAKKCTTNVSSVLMANTV